MCSAQAALLGVLRRSHAEQPHTVRCCQGVGVQDVFDRDRQTGTADPA